MIYDITRTITPSIAVWPGDTNYHVEPQLQLSEGVSVNLTTLTLSAHTGTHADAWFHYEENGKHPAQMPLDSYIGKALVHCVQKRNGTLTPDDFENLGLDEVDAVLVHSHVSDLEDTQWAEEFPYLSVELIEWLAQYNIQLVGLDSPSVDAFDSTELPCHHALYAHKMVNLETLFLRDVPDGIYELIALPLKLDLACGSPVRAILREL